MSTMRDVVGDLPTTWLDPGEVAWMRRFLAAGDYDPYAAGAIWTLLEGIHEMAIEIDRCHERMARADVVVVAARAACEAHGGQLVPVVEEELPALLGRLERAEATVEAARLYLDYTPWLLNEIDDHDSYVAMRAAETALEAALAAYDKGEGGTA